MTMMIPWNNKREITTSTTSTTTRITTRTSTTRKTFVAAPIEKEEKSQNSKEKEEYESMTRLAEELFSYQNLNQALADRHETICKGDENRLSQGLVNDIMSLANYFVFQQRHEQQSHTPPPLPNQTTISSWHIAQLIQTLLLPRSSIIVPSHSFEPLLELISFTFQHLKESHTTYDGATATAKQQQKAITLTLEDAMLCRSILHNLSTVQIYLTMPLENHLLEQYKHQLVYLLNTVLQIYSLASQNFQLEIPVCQNIIQQAEHTLLDFMDAANQHNQQRNNKQPTNSKHLHQLITLPPLQPDVVSFNTIMMTWARAAQRRRAPRKHDNRRRPRSTLTAPKHSRLCAQRAHDMLNLLNKHETYSPTAHSYVAAIRGWGNAQIPVETPKKIMQILDTMLTNWRQQRDQQYQEYDQTFQDDKNHQFDAKIHPPPDPATMVMACTGLRRNTVQDNLKCLQTLTRIIHQVPRLLPLEEKLFTAMLTVCAYSKSTPTDHYFKACHEMNRFWNEHATTRNATVATYNIVIEAWSNFIQKVTFDREKPFYEQEQWQQVETAHEICFEFLKEAQDSHNASIQTYNYALGACRYHLHHAEDLFAQMQEGDIVDNLSYRNLFEAFEHAPGDATTAERAQQILDQMIELAKTDESFRPQTNLFNSVIIAWSNVNTLEGSERAHALLESLCESYQHIVNEMLSDDKTSQTLQKYLTADSNPLPERPNTTSFITVMSSIAQHGNNESHVLLVEELLERLEDMALARSLAASSKRMHFMAPIIISTPVAYNIVLQMFAKFGMVEKAERLLKRMERVMVAKKYGQVKPDEWSYMAVFGAYSQRARQEQGNDNVLSRVRHLLNLKTQAKNAEDGETKIMTRQVYNALLDALASLNANTEHEDEAINEAVRQITAEMSSFGDDKVNDNTAGVGMDRISYGTTLKRMVQPGTLSAALKAQEYLQKSVRETERLISLQGNADKNDDVSLVDTVSFNIVLKAFCSLKSKEGSDNAQTLFQQMKEVFQNRGWQFVRPDRFSYGSVILTLPPQQAQDVLEEFIDIYKRDERPEDEPDGRIITSVINKWFHSPSNNRMAGQHAEHLWRIKAQLYRDYGITEPTEHDLKTVLRRHIKDGHINLARALFDEMASSKKKQHYVTLESLNTLLGGYSTTGNGVEATKILQQIIESGFTPNDVTYRSCITAWARSNAPDRDVQVMNLLQQYKKATTDLSSLAKMYNLVLKTCRHLALMRNDAATKEPIIVQALDLFREMLQMPVEDAIYPQTFTHSMILSSQIQDEKQKEALVESLIRFAQQRGLISPSFILAMMEQQPPKLSQHCCKILRVPPAAWNTRRSENVYNALPREWTQNSENTTSKK